MAEAFVDVTYRGLELGKRLKLRDVKPEAAYLEVPLPMPVGTRISIDTGDGVVFEAFVTAVHEQIGGSDQIPGMKVRPTLAGKSLTWWNERCDGVAVESPVEAVPQPVPEETSRSKKNGRRNGKRNTVPPPPEPEPVSPAIVAALAAEAAQAQDLADDGRSTETMAAVDPVALGLSTDDDASGGGRTAVMSAVDMEALAAAGDTVHDDDDDVELTIEAEDGDPSPSASGSMPAQGAQGKKKRARRKKR